MRAKCCLSLGLIFNVVFAAFPAPGQTNALPTGNAQTTEVAIGVLEEPLEAYLGLLRAGNGPFVDFVTAITSDEDTAIALNAQSLRFFELFRDGTKGQLPKVYEKAAEYQEKRYEELKKNPPRGVSAKKAISTRSTPDVFDYGISRVPFRGRTSTEVSFAKARFSPNATDAPEIVVTETETGMTSTVSDTKTIEYDGSTVTRHVNGNGSMIFDGKNTVSTEMNTIEMAEVASKVDRSKASDEQKITRSASFEVCPDSAGIVRGRAKIKLYYQTTINTGTQLAALTTEYLMEYQFTGHVNDAAEMTDFDMAGSITEKTFGYDRAYRLGLAANKNGITDGSRSIAYTTRGNSPQFGNDKTSVDFRNSTSKGSGIDTRQDQNRISDVNAFGLTLIIIDVKALMRTSMSNWRDGKCVAVECSSGKKSLKPNESAEVEAVSVSKMDAAKFNAKLDAIGTQTVSPESQFGKPNVSFTLIAPDKRKARIIVTSTSRRGIGTEILEIPVVEPEKPKPPRKPAPKPKDCDGGWTGTVKAVTASREDRAGNPSGMLVRSIFSKNESFTVEIDVLGTRDTSGGIVNNFRGMSRVGYIQSDYRELTYASGRMSCSTGIIESGQVQKYDAQVKGDASGPVLVAISVNRTAGYISFSPPVISAERIVSRIYESNCPSYNAANTSTERDNDPITISNPGFEVEFEVDPETPNQIRGSKKVQNSDGSETTYSWDLTRCG